MDATRTLTDRYELEEVIGRGGMGTVYRARDLILGRAVAVKLLPPDVADRDPVNVVRFQNEARAAAGLNHPSLVAVYDTGTDATDRRFIVMELVAGRSLEATLRSDGPLDPDLAAGIAAQVADALAAAHAAGIVHRDIKPANVMVTDDDRVKVLDFGIARAVDGTTLTHGAAVLGTAAYMAPERANGQPADARSDIYSLGCVLYAALTGHPPFRGDNAAAVLHQHASVTPRSPRAERAAVPPALDALVMRMLAKSPRRRPQSAAEVRDELEAFRGVPTRSTVPIFGDEATTALMEPVGPVAAPSWKRPALIAAAAAVLLIAILVAPGGGSSSHRASGAGGHAVSKSVRASTKVATGSASVPATTATGTGSAAVGSAPAGATVSQAASAVTALLTEDAQSGAIDQHAAERIAEGVSHLLAAYQAGRTDQVQHRLAELSAALTSLQRGGHVTAGAVPALSDALAAMGAAIAHNAPPASGAPPVSGSPSPGQGTGDQGAGSVGQGGGGDQGGQGGGD